MRTLCGCVVACSVLLSSFLGSAAWSQSGTSEPPGLDEIIAAANSYVQASPSWTPAEAPEGAGPESDEGGNSDVLDPEASVLPDAAAGEAVPFALNDSIYSGSISTTILDIFAGVCAKYPSKDYVAFRSGQYTYDLYIGDISLAGAFSGTQLLHVVYDSSSNYNNGPYLRYNTEDLGLTPGMSLVYSNLGDYPALPIQGVPYEKALIFGGVVIFLFILFRWVFSRSR